MTEETQHLPTVDGNAKVMVERKGVNQLVTFWEMQVGDIYLYEGRKFEITDIGGLVDKGDEAVEIRSFLVDEQCAI